MVTQVASTVPVFVIRAHPGLADRGDDGVDDERMPVVGEPESVEHQSLGHPDFSQFLIDNIK